MVRNACVAGQFYPSDETDLMNEIKRCFSAKYGPGDLPVKKREKNITAAIVPHAGYTFSGPCAAWAYKEIAESEFPDVYVILAPTHRAQTSGISIEDWKTPFGMIKTDKDYVIGLKNNTHLKISEEPHHFEHSLEVQLPFLQFVSKGHSLKIVPIAISRDIDFNEIGAELSKYEKESKKKICYIVSSDFTHYGQNYGYLPFTSDIEKRLNDLDKGAIDLITSNDINGFVDYLNKTGITICGYLPILVLMKILEARKIEPHLLMHYTSADIMGNNRNSVSYVSIVFK